MGNGGYIELFNGTKYAWRQIFYYKNMNHWNFPDIIPENHSERVYIEFEGEGSVTYEIQSPTKRIFTLHGKDENVTIENSTVEDYNNKDPAFGENSSAHNLYQNPRGSVLGFHHDGTVVFQVFDSDIYSGK